MMYRIALFVLAFAFFSPIQAHAVPDSVVNARYNWAAPTYFDDYTSPVTGEQFGNTRNVNEQVLKTADKSPKRIDSSKNSQGKPRSQENEATEEAVEPDPSPQEKEPYIGMPELPSIRSLSDLNNWSGSIDGGVSIANGNTKKEDFNAALKLLYEGRAIRNTFKASLRNESEDGTTTAEEYRASNKTDFKMTERDYLFFEMEYVDDRFSGYDYRFTEDVGYGRSLIKTDRFTWNAEASVGGRHSERTDQSGRLDEFITKLATDTDWKITDNISNLQSLEVAFGEEATITEYELSLKADIYESLYLKAKYNIEHISDVPAGSENTDTLTTVNLGYSF